MNFGNFARGLGAGKSFGGTIRSHFDDAALGLGSVGRKGNSGLPHLSKNKRIPRTPDQLRRRGYRRMAYGGGILGATVVGTSSGVNGTSPRSMGGTA